MARVTKAELKRVMSHLGKKGGKSRSPAKLAAIKLNAQRKRPGGRNKAVDKTTTSK